MTARCVFCPTSTSDPDGWVDVVLVDVLEWRSVFGPLPTPRPGAYSACPTCAAWLPDHRTGPLPPLVAAGINAVVDDADLHSQTARQLRSELVGMTRDLAAHLQLVDDLEPGG